MEFQEKCKEARHRIIMLEKSKAMKRVKELRELQEKEESATNSKQQKTQQKQPEANPTSNPFEDEGNPFLETGKTGLNPFDEDDEGVDGDGDDGMNPFLQEDDSKLPFHTLYGLLTEKPVSLAKYFPERPAN